MYCLGKKEEGTMKVGGKRPCALPPHNPAVPGAPTKSKEAETPKGGE